MAQSLADWAIRGPGDLVVDPSFGGTVFLHAAHRRLIALGLSAEQAGRQIYGASTMRRRSLWRERPCQHQVSIRAPAHEDPDDRVRLIWNPGVGSVSVEASREPFEIARLTLPFPARPYCFS